MTSSPAQFLESFRRMESGRRLGVIAAAAVAVALIGFAGRWGATPTYVTLYHDVDLKESGQMTDQLRKADIPFKLGGGGTEILVPVSQVAAARVALAREGLPSSGKPGLELFDKASWAMTDFTQRVTFQRALEGELSRTISGIRGVDRAEVHLVMPVSSAVRRMDRPASASVVLGLKPGVVLSRETVQGIVYVVSNSVEQLSPESVAVMDDGGKVLSAPGDASSGEAMSNRQQEVQRGLEERLEEKVEDLLATVVGVGGTRARVSAQLSFDSVDRTTETYNPDGQVLQTEQRSETGAGSGAEAQTIVSNAYQNSRQVEKSSTSAGELKRLTVAVLVDSKALESIRTKSGIQLPQIEALVKDAVGADSARGDRVSVMAVPFGLPVTPTAAGLPAGKNSPDVMQIVERASRPAVSVVAIVAVLLVAMAGLKGVSGPRNASEPTAAGRAAAPTSLPTGETNGRNRINGEGAGEISAEVVRAWLAEGS